MSSVLGFCVLVVLVTQLTPADAGWYRGWSVEVPTNCPHRNNETNVCSTIQSINGTCFTIACCENDDSGEMTNHGGHHDDYHGCRLCIFFSQCVIYRCRRSCCDGYERDFWGGCTNETGNLQCENGGVLHSTWWGTMYCDCAEGFSGHNCEIPICDCQNNGECVVEDGKPTCNCLEGYHGDTCEKSNCNITTCHNGGQCYKDGDEEFCRCPSDYIGRQCEQYYINPKTCPVPDDVSDMCDHGCTSNSDCEDDYVCCKEGCSSLCREPKAEYCLYEGRRYTINSTYSPDPCMTCECTVTGEMMCYSLSCAYPSCAFGEPTVQPGDCCPTCPEKSDPPTLNNCPTSVLYLDTTAEGDMAWLNETNTQITAVDSEGNALQVKYMPEKVHHCHCSPEVGSKAFVQAYASDSFESKTTCSFYAIVKDVYPPQFTYCPDDISVAANQVVTWKKPIYEDNVGTAKVTYPDSVSGDVLAVGSHDLTYIVADHDGNTASCSFTVTVIREPPTMTNCPTDAVQLSTAFYTYYAVVDHLSTGILASDSDDYQLQVYYEPENVKHCRCSDPLTTEYTVVARATDDFGKNASCSFSVVVNDIYKPRFTYCPDDISVSEGDTVPWKEPTYTDNVWVNQVEYNNENGQVFPVGKTVVKYVIFDYDGNQEECQFNVYVEENKPEPPEIQNCPSELVLVNTSFYTDNAFLDDRLTGLRAFDAEGHQVVVTYQPDRVQHCQCYLPARNPTEVTAYAYDENGNHATCQFKVVVKDIYQPVFTSCPNNIYVSENKNVTWQEPTYSDNVKVAGTSVPTFQNGQVFSVGKHVVFYKIWDFDGNEASCMFNISVTKEEPKPPRIVNCPTQILQLTTPYNSDQVELFEQTTSIQAYDNEGTKLKITYEPDVARHCYCNDVHTAETTIQASVTDGDGITETCTFNVTVTDNQKPVITYCPAGVEAYEGQTVEWKEPEFEDNVAISKVMGNRENVQAFSVGTHSVYYTAFDYDSNNATCRFVVTVSKRKPPKITCPTGVVSLNTPSTSDSVTLSESTTAIGAYDTDGNKLKVNFAPSSVRHCYCHNSATDETQVTASAQDRHGNSASCSIRVVVVDNVKPVIDYCPSDLNFTEDHVVSWRSVEASDNVQIDKETHSGRLPGSKLPAGIYRIAYDFWDFDGNHATCQFRVAVVKAKCTLECYNGGHCFKSDNTESCRCTPGYTGIQCEEKHTATHCKHEGRWYRINETYNPDPCTNCTCTSSGEMICFTVQCAPAKCSGGRPPVSRPDKCCLECPVESKPVIVCPSHIVHVNTLYYTNYAALDGETTSVRAYGDSNKNLQVSFQPQHVYHCNCHNPSAHETTVVASASDNHGYTARCSFKVVVKDIYPPKLFSCPEDSFLYENKKAVWLQLDATDNVGVAGSSCSSENGTVFPLGDHRINCNIWDYDRNTATCQFHVFVNPEDTPFEDLPLGYREKGKEENKLLIILPAIIGAVVLAVLVALLLYCCRRRQCKPDFFKKKSPKPPQEENIYAELGDVASTISSKSKRGSMSTYSSVSSKTVSSRALAFRNGIYTVPGDVGVRPPPYTPSLYSPPPYSVSGSIKDVTYMPLPVSSYPNPGYGTLSVHRSSVYSPSIVSGSTVASRSGKSRSSKSSRRSTAGSTRSSRSSKSSYLA